MLRHERNLHIWRYRDLTCQMDRLDWSIEELPKNMKFFE